MCGITGGPGRITIRGYPLSRLASSLTTPLQRVVLDKTSLVGPWNIDLRFARSAGDAEWRRRAAGSEFTVAGDLVSDVIREENKGSYVGRRRSA